jgi:hypothetical protein
MPRMPFNIPGRERELRDFTKDPLPPPPLPINSGKNLFSNVIAQQAGKGTLSAHWMQNKNRRIKARLPSRVQSLLLLVNFVNWLHTCNIDDVDLDFFRLYNDNSLKSFHVLYIIFTSSKVVFSPARRK